MTGGEWRNTRVKHVAQVTLGKMLQPAPKTPRDSLRTYARAASIGQDGSLVTTGAKSMWFSEAESRELDLRQNDILVVEGGDAGRSVMIQEDFPGWGFQNSVNRVRTAPGVEPRFVHYALISARDSGFISAYCDVVSIAHLTAEKLKRVPVSVPPYEQQRAIADYLDYETAKIDTLIAKQEALIATLRERRAVAVARLVWRGTISGAIPPLTGEPWRDAPAHWARVRNKQVFTERVSLSEDGSEEPLSVSHITGVTPRADKNVTMFEAESQVGSRKVEVADLVINTMWAWMGALGFSSTAGIVSPAYGVYTAKPGVPFEPRYFDALVRSREYVGLMTAHSRGMWSSRLRLYPDVFLSLPTVLPPKQDQIAIADMIKQLAGKLDSLVEKSERFIMLAKERRAALITAAVTGDVSPRA